MKSVFIFFFCLSHPFSSIFFCCTELLHILLYHLHDSSMWSFSFISCLAARSLSSFCPIYQSAHVQTNSSLPLLRCLPIIHHSRAHNNLFYSCCYSSLTNHPWHSTPPTTPYLHSLLHLVHCPLLGMFNPAKGCGTNQCTLSASPMPG